jgi:large subunit ribosomal protein L14e
MELFEVGRVCIKTSGRHAGKYVVVVEKIDKNYVMVNGEGKKKKSNLKHLEPLNISIKVNKDDSSENIVKLLKEKGCKIKTPKKHQITPKKVKEKKSDKK